jgi:transcriptional regulator with XRE-family HTH domain
MSLSMMPRSINPGDDPIHASLGRAIRELRTTSRVSQEQLAERAGLHRLYLGGVERGERNPTLHTIVRVARALEVAPSELLARAERLTQGDDPPRG